MRKYFFLSVLVFAFIFPTSVKAQPPSPDSLVQWLKDNPKPDTNRVKNLVDLAYLLYRSYPDSARGYGKAGLNLARGTDFKYREASALRVIGYTHGVQGRSDSALYYFNLALPIFEELEDDRNIASMNAAMGADYARDDQFELAMQAFLGAATAFNSFGNTHAEGVMYSNIGNIFLEQELFLEAEEYYELALATLTEPQHEVSLTLVYSNLGILSEATGKIEEAVNYAEKGIENALKYNQLTELSGLYQTKGRAHKELGEIEAALDSFTASLEFNDKVRNQKDYTETIFEIGYLEFSLGDYLNAKDKLEEVVSITRENNLTLNDFLPKALTLLARTNQQLGNFDSGLSQALEAQIIEDSLHNEEMALRISELETIYETEKKEAQIRFLVVENQVANLRILVISILGSFALLFMALGFWWYYRKKSEQKRRKMESMKSELQKFGLVISEKNNFISQFKEELDEVRRHVRTLEGRKELTSLVDSIHQNINMTEEEDELFNKIDQVNAGFYAELRQKSNQLTDKDERLATLIQMDLSNKDIANILHVEPDSVKRAKNRLKKKLQLDGETDLGEYLKGLAA